MVKIFIFFYSLGFLRFFWCKIGYICSCIMKRFAIFFIFLSSFYAFSSEDNFNSSPYSTIYTHIHYLQNEEYDLKTAAKAFNSKNIKEAEHNAVQLKQILDGKGIFIKLNDIPDKVDYYDTLRKRSVYVLNSRLPQVYLEKVGDNWYYSKETVDAIPRLHKMVYPFGSAVWVKLFPYQSGKTFLKLHYWQWIGLAAIILIFLGTYFISRQISYFIIKKIAERKISNPFDDVDLLRVIANSFSLVLAFFGLKLILPTLLLSTKLSASLTKSVDLVAAVILIWYLYSLTDFIMRYAAQAAKKTPSQLDDQLIQVLRRFLKAGVVIFGIFYLLRILDVNVTTVIAGISIGGLAIALAAQDTVKNFIGSLMIFADRPFKIGDTISGDGFEGVVQEVGFRSTRIKTPADSIVTVANGKLADMTIDNKGYKILKKYKTEIFISYETPLPKVEKFIEGIRTILMKYPFTKNSSIDVFLANIHANGMTVSINYTYKVYNQREEFQHREFILLNILRLANLLHIKLFEQQQHVLLEQKSEDAVKISDEDIEHQLDRFFADFDSEASQKK